MKKLLLVGLVILGITLSGCRDNPPSCEEGYLLNEKTNECVLDTSCDEGYLWNDETASCEIEVVVHECQSGYVWNDETAECEEIDQTTELERAFENSIGIDNYQMDIEVTEGIETIHMVLLFMGQTSSLTVHDMTEYFVQEGMVCTRITEQLGQVIEETIDCITADDSRFDFFHAFDIEWFEEQGEFYVITEGNFDALNNFFRTSIPGAVVSNFKLYLDNDYFDQFDFVVTTPDTSFTFVIDFSAIGSTLIEVPTSE